MPKEPPNPIRCPECGLIVGVQGFMKHLNGDKHDKIWAPGEYDMYVKLNTVKRNDTENPLRYEWRKQNGKTKN